MAKACGITETERSSDVIGAQQGRSQIVFRQCVTDACQKLLYDVPSALSLRRRVRDVVHNTEAIASISGKRPGVRVSS